MSQRLSIANALLDQLVEAEAQKELRRHFVIKRITCETPYNLEVLELKDAYKPPRSAPYIGDGVLTSLKRKRRK